MLIVISYFVKIKNSKDIFGTVIKSVKLLLVLSI